MLRSANSQVSDVELALSIAALFAIGLWVSAIARSQNVALAIGQLLLWPMLFFAGLFVPRPGRDVLPYRRASGVVEPGLVDLPSPGELAERARR